MAGDWEVYSTERTSYVFWTVNYPSIISCDVWAFIISIQMVKFHHPKLPLYPETSKQKSYHRMLRVPVLSWDLAMWCKYAMDEDIVLKNAHVCVQKLKIEQMGVLFIITNFVSQICSMLTNIASHENLDIRLIFTFHICTSSHMYMNYNTHYSPSRPSQFVCSNNSCDKSSTIYTVQWVRQLSKAQSVQDARLFSHTA